MPSVRLRSAIALFHLPLGGFGSGGLTPDRQHCTEDGPRPPRSGPTACAPRGTAPQRKAVQQRPL